MSEEEKRLTAYHEGGHALVGMMLEHADPVHKVTIIPRGRAGGYTLMLPKEDRAYATRSELLDRLKVAMGGRVAEEVVLKEISTGASQDIQQASKIVRGMIMQYGMSDLLGPVAYGDTQRAMYFGNDRNYSEEVAAEIDREVKRYMEDAYSECRRIITENLDKLDMIAQTLLERETLTAAELEEIVKQGKVPEKDSHDDETPPDDPNIPMMIPIPPEVTVTLEKDPVVEKSRQESGGMIKTPEPEPHF